MSKGTGLQASALRTTATAELQETLKKLEEGLFKDRLKKATNQLENVMVIRRARRDIARVKTVLGEQARKGNESARAAETGSAAVAGAEASKEK